MITRTAPLLHRDNPDKDPLVGHVKVTREDWLNLARDVLVNDGVGEVKVAALGARLAVARSSFYGYFESREHLLAELLDDWERRNTRSIVESVEAPAASITEAVCNFFRCFIDPKQFDDGLDFAVREWSRRDTAVRERIDHADAERLHAISTMYERFDFPSEDASTRARILYFMQLGYHALELRETIEVRMSRLEGYLRGFIGMEPDPKPIADFLDYVKSKQQA